MVVLCERVAVILCSACLISSAYIRNHFVFCVYSFLRIELHSLLQHFKHQKPIGAHDWPTVHVVNNVSYRYVYICVGENV